MSNIYDLHDKAFASVSSYAVLKDGEFVASIAFKYPRDGAGRLWAYVHFLGEPMVRGYASGGGYDKHSAACASAVRNIDLSNHGGTDFEMFVRALSLDNGYYWNDNLRAAGFKVHATC